MRNKGSRLLTRHFILRPLAPRITISICENLHINKGTTNK